MNSNVESGDRHTRNGLPCPPTRCRQLHVHRQRKRRASPAAGQSRGPMTSRQARGGSSSRAPHISQTSPTLCKVANGIAAEFAPYGVRSVTATRHGVPPPDCAPRAQSVVLHPQPISALPSLTPRPWPPAPHRPSGPTASPHLLRAVKPPLSPRWRPSNSRPFASEGDNNQREDDIIAEPPVPGPPPPPAPPANLTTSGHSQAVPPHIPRLPGHEEPHLRLIIFQRQAVDFSLPRFSCGKDRNKGGGCWDQKKGS